MERTTQKIYLGILGDPAKEELYPDEFFEILKWDESHSTFALIGASESHYPQFLTSQTLKEKTSPRISVYFQAHYLI